MMSNRTERNYLHVAIEYIYIEHMHSKLLTDIGPTISNAMYNQNIHFFREQKQLKLPIATL